MSGVVAQQHLTSEPFGILLGHNRWANAQLLAHCEALSTEQFHQKFDIGPGSLHDTLTHIIGAMLRWSDRIGGTELRPSIEGQQPGSEATKPCRTAQELAALNIRAADQFASVVGRAKAEGWIDQTRDWQVAGQSYVFNVSAAIIHVTNHGMHHRAQCMNMLKKLGRPVNADLDEIEWQLAGEPA